MNSTSGGIFDFEQLNRIRDAHRDWCAQSGIDPKSPFGQEAAGMMLEAYQTGKTSYDALIGACEDYAKLRSAHVRPGTTPIDSRS
ncbi:hypothetical protein [Neorhizobium alkalisoli]|uniref:Uncharacterized protein n=1 Tax=Neorhizobium alkalisoli TaxID=528178 RepID=A0A561QV16_9HYPH|nr:hypothetical protein [Neorhizobium alkalisoli]TWF54202.1 hypothetical protein FHW37_10363 [Neorhizobium alkalisoli]